MTSNEHFREGVSVPEPVDAESVRRELEELTNILEDASVRLHVLEYHFARIEADEIVAGTRRTSVSQTYTMDELSGMISTYFDSPCR